MNTIGSIQGFHNSNQKEKSEIRREVIIYEVIFKFFQS